MVKRKITRFTRKLKWFFGIYLMPKHIATVNTKNGLLSFNSKDRTLGRSLSVEREFEYDGMNKTVKLLVDNKHIEKPQGHTVMDVGGYIGMIGIGFLTIGLFKKALMFEPNPDSFTLIKQNINQNNMNSVISAHNLALSDTESELEMELSDKNYGDHRIRKSGVADSGHYNEQKRKTIKIRAIPFDSFVNENENIDFSDIKLIWMDIQGHEGSFLTGAVQFIQNHKNIPIAMEFWPYGILRSGTTKEKFCSLIEKLYTHFYILDEDPNTLHKVSEVSDYFDRYVKTPWGGAHLICVN